MKVNRQRLSVGSFFYTIETCIHKIRFWKSARKEGGKTSEERCHESCYVQRTEKKKLSKITINDIASECNISRMTFYYHFQDIYDLAEWTLEEAAGRAIGENRTYSSWQQGFEDLLEELQSNQVLILNVYRSMDREMIERYLLKKAETLLMPVVEQESQGIGVSEEAKRRVAVFYSYAFLGVLMEWISKGMTTSPHEIVMMVSAIIQGDFRNSLKNISRLNLDSQKQ